MKILLNFLPSFDFLRKKGYNQGSKCLNINCFLRQKGDGIMNGDITENEKMDTYALIDDIAKLFGVYVGRAVQNKKMSYGHRRLLMCLYHGEEVDQLQLIGESNLTSSAVSTELAGMEGRGYVRRRPDPEDQRKTLVRITDKGKARYRSIKSSSKQIEDAMLFGIKPEERQQLADLLRKVLDNLVREGIRYR